MEYDGSDGSEKVFAFKADPASVKPTGEFEGYAAIYGNLDEVGDIIRPGAFDAVVAELDASGVYPPIVWNHDKDKPIGQQILVSDAKGLKVIGKLWVEQLEQARAAAMLLRETTYYMSFWSTDWEYVFDGADNRVITLVRNILETSITTHPANRDAQVMIAKNARASRSSYRQQASALSAASNRLDQWLAQFASSH